MRHLPLLAISCLLTLSAHAAGPTVIAKVDRQLWQSPINTVNTVESFDNASRAAVLMYALSLQDAQKLSDSDMKAAFKIKTVNRASVTQWLNKELALALRNYQAATKNCVEADFMCVANITSTDELLKQAKTLYKDYKPASLQMWPGYLRGFTDAYAAEQLRLAALFPTVSSEIDTFNTNEWNGDAFSDRQFLLTFDDGPTKPQGDTDKVLAMLAAKQKSAVFFVLGGNLQNRLNKTDAKTLAELYKGQCVALHGWAHQSHAKWANWQDSIKRTQTLLTSLLPTQSTEKTGSFSPLFRPPYGQRKADSGAFFQQQGLQVALWNLDSQDWNNQVDSEAVLNRMRTLMLIKRHGVLLFHDVHPKAKTALPMLFQELGNAVEWLDCHNY
jgi:peptidoglycan/xylan/chitin deacetylase (PgdA/CDA1 family)